MKKSLNKQAIVFTSMMVFMMVTIMVTYNTTRITGGMSYNIILNLLSQWYIYVIAFVLEYFFISKIAMLLFNRFVPDNSSRFVKTISRSFITVCLMAPTMALITTIIKNNYSSLIESWALATLYNYPMALGVQLLFVGPVVRKLFKKIMPRL